MNAAAPSPVPPHLVDAQGLACPMPLLKLRQALHGLQIGESVRVLTTDPNSQQDIRRYCERSGKTCSPHGKTLKPLVLIFKKCCRLPLKTHISDQK